jgi:hypothetical protein
VNYTNPKDLWDHFGLSSSDPFTGEITLKEESPELCQTLKVIRSK